MNDSRVRITRVIRFSREIDFSESAIVRVYNGHLKNLGGRNGWVQVKNGEKCVYRLIKGSPIPADVMEVDYDTRIELGIQRDARSIDGGWECEIFLSPATAPQRVAAHWRHPDLGHRVSFQLGLIGLALGVLGFAQGLWSLLN